MFPRQVKLGGVELKPLEIDGGINFMDIGNSLEIEEKVLEELGPQEFWKSLPIMELQRA